MIHRVVRWLLAPRRRLAGAERVSHVALNIHCERVRATLPAPRGPFNLLERVHGLAEIVERGAGVLVERPRVSPPHHEHEIMIRSENASRHGHHSAHEFLGFFEAP